MRNAQSANFVAPVSAFMASFYGPAAQGNAAALARLADAHYQRGLDGIEPPVIALARATEYARLAAISRDERQDWISLIFLLQQHADALRNEGEDKLADLSTGEAIAIAEHVAIAGDEEVGQMIVNSAAAVSPGALRLARNYRSYLRCGRQSRSAR